MAKRTGKRVMRTDLDLMRSLVGHVSLLHEYRERAFGDGDGRFLGEIASKLRLLAIRSKTNHPLLIDLMEKHRSGLRVVVDKPWGKSFHTLDEYLNRDALTIRTADGSMAAFTKREFVASWAQQHGGAHEDLLHDPGFAASRESGVAIGGIDAHARMLRAICDTVLLIADDFLKSVGASSPPVSRPHLAGQ